MGTFNDPCICTSLLVISRRGQWFVGCSSGGGAIQLGQRATAAADDHAGH